jgi:VCBS repeat-containing protein
VAKDDSATTNEDTAANGNVLTNDTDVDSANLTATKVAGPTHGTLIFNANGSYTYTPNANYNGSDSFTYKANDGTADSNVATVSITVTAVNDAPVGTDDFYTTFEDTDLTVSAANGLLKNDTDIDNDQLRVDDADATATGINPVSGPSHGTLTLNADGSFTYKPNADYNGSDSFTYRVCDNGSPTPKCSVETANVNIKIDPVNDAPVAVNDTATTDEDTAASINVIANDTDVDNTNAELSVSSFTQPSHGTVSRNADGTLKYTPAADYNGPDSFTYKAKDSSLDSNTATVSITVTAVNDAPVAVDDTATTPEDTPVKFLASELLGNDSTGPANESGQTLTIKSVTNGQNGQAVLNTDGSVTFTPAANFNGAASFDYTVCDNGVPQKCYEGTATVKVTVSAVNDAPSFTKGANQTVAEDSGPQTVPGWASGISAGPADESGQAVDFLVSTNNDALFSAAPTVSSNGALTYTPAANASGTATVTVRAHDSGGTANGGVDTSASQTFTITVNAVNDNPVIASVTNNGPANEGSPATIKVTANDVDGDTLSYAFDCDNNGTFEVGPQAASSAQCTFNDEGTYRVTVKVTDGNGGSATDSTSVVVNNVNPTIGALTTTGSGTACLGSNNVATLSFSITDPGTSDTHSGTINWGDGTTTTFTGSSVTQQHSYSAGTYNITVTASDNDGGTAVPKTTTAAQQVSLRYNVSELQDPVNRTGMTMSVFKHGSTVPLRVLITDCNGQPVNGLVPKISFTKVNPATPVVGVNEALSTQPNDTNFLMRDAGNGQYVYNLNTKTLVDGDATYNATITDSQATQTASATYGPKTSQNFGLRSK